MIVLILLWSARSHRRTTPLLGALTDPSFTRVAGIQCTNLVQYFSSASCTATEASAATIAVSKSLFPQAMKDKIIDAIATSMAGCGIQAQSKFQYWEQMWEFMPEDVWATMGTAEFPANAMQFLLRAGLRSPSEATFKATSTEFLFGSADKDHAMTMDVSTRQTGLNMAKTWFRTEANWVKLRRAVHSQRQRLRLAHDKDSRPLVRAMDCNTHDSTHIFFSDGICNIY